MSWGDLLALVREARNPPADPREAVTCPNDGATLVNGHCPFDGYRTAAASPSSRSSSADWGGLRAALTDP